VKVLDAANPIMAVDEAADFVIGVWFVAFDAAANSGRSIMPCDIMATLWREPSGKRRMVVRARWDAGTDDPLDDRKKSGEHRGIDGATSDEEAIAAGTRVVEDMIERVTLIAPVSLPLEFIRVDGDHSTMIAKMSTRPWCRIIPMSSQGQA